MPGYFGLALSTHRQYFELPGYNDLFCFSASPVSAMRFSTQEEAEVYLQALCESGNGRWRPLTIITIFE